jgi:hypothetical protein
MALGVEVVGVELENPTPSSRGPWRSRTDRTLSLAVPRVEALVARHVEALSSGGSPCRRILDVSVVAPRERDGVESAAFSVDAIRRLETRVLGVRVGREEFPGKRSCSKTRSRLRTCRPPPPIAAHPRGKRILPRSCARPVRIIQRG